MRTKIQNFDIKVQFPPIIFDNYPYLVLDRGFLCLCRKKCLKWQINSKYGYSGGGLFLTYMGLLKRATFQTCITI